MAQAIVDPSILGCITADVYEKLNQLSKSEEDMKTNDKIYVDIIKKKIIFLEESEFKDVI